MSVLAGFDMVVELSRQSLEELIAAATLGGQSLSAPTEVVLNEGPIALDLLVLEPVALTLSPADESWATITVPFEDSSLMFDNQTLNPAKGTLVITGTFKAVVVAPGSIADSSFAQQLAFCPSIVTHTFDESVPYCAQALKELPDRAGFESTMDFALSLGLGSQQLPAGPLWLIDTTQNGTIGGRFCTPLQVAPVSDQIVGLFGSLLLGNVGHGVTSQKTPSLATGANVAVSISAAAFHDIIWCPHFGGAAAASLADQPAQLAQWVADNLPGDCGGASSILLTGDIYLTQVRIEFTAGSIQVSGSVSQSEQGVWCFGASGSFFADLTFAINNGALAPVLNPNPPATDISVDVNWYCALLFLAVAAIGGLVSVVIVTVIGAIALAIIDIVVSNQTIPKFPIGPVQIGFAGIVWTGTSITTEGLTLQGKLPTPTPAPGGWRHLSLDLSETSGAVVPVGSGTYHFPGSKACPPQDFAYVENHVDETLTATATTQLLGHPRTFAWTIGQDPPVPLTGSSGTVVVNAHASLPEPNGVAQQLGLQAMTLDFQIGPDGSTLTLTDANHYLYTLLVRADCTDGSGASVADWQEIEVIGDTIVFGSDYTSFMANCMVATKDLILHMRTLPEGVPRNGDPGDLTGEQLVQVLSAAAAQGVLNEPAVAEVSAMGGAGLRGEVFVAITGAGNHQLEAGGPAPG